MNIIKKSIWSAFKTSVLFSVISFFINLRHPYSLSYFLNDIKAFLCTLTVFFLVDLLFNGCEVLIKSKKSKK